MEEYKYTTLRTPIVAVLGHVDSGKTTFLDKVRSTNVAAKEAGFITQHIGATEIPLSTIQNIAGPLIQKFGFKLSIPGLLFIDTPGHEAFANLRERGSSIADLGVLLVDVNKGLQPQTREAISILRAYKVPFVVGLNKLDLLEGYDSAPGSFLENHARQLPAVQKRLDERLYTLVGELHGMGFASERFDRVEDTTKEIAIVPICNPTGEGIPEMLVFLAGISQKFLETKLRVVSNSPGKGTCLEVREEKGMGTTLDVILYDGHIKVGDAFVVAGRDGVIQSKVRALLRPNILTDIRMAETFISVKEIYAAAGVKISAPDLDNALAGSPFLVVHTGNEAQHITQEVNRIKIENDHLGVILKTDTLGSLEALVKLLQTHSIRIKRADVGQVTRRDVMEAAAIRAKDPYLGVIFAFNTSVHDAARGDAEKEQVKLFESTIIYSLTEDYLAWVETQKSQSNIRLMQQVIFPCKLQVLPGFVFRQSKPAVVGVRILNGRLKKGTELLNARGEKVGRVVGIQSEKDEIEIAETGKDVAISIDQGVIGKNVNPHDVFYSYIAPAMHAILMKLGDKITPEEKELLKDIHRLRVSETPPEEGYE
ncbi:MAG: translation initiation factor IF-2 [Candidatus Diapherotrites archaeon]|nr:translation initiation factor IF-2 [Candidatus Diapherotrites archaeon]MDZ4256284.1 translation initiation factor IF-2 [archaeon]